MLNVHTDVPKSGKKKTKLSTSLNTGQVSSEDRGATGFVLELRDDSGSPDKEGVSYRAARPCHMQRLGEEASYVFCCHVI